MTEINAKHSSVKVFTASNPGNLESEIQRWLSSQSKEAVIYKIKYAVANANTEEYIYSALILFSEAKKSYF